MSIIIIGNGSCNPEVFIIKKLLFLEINLNVLKMRLSSSPRVLSGFQEPSLTYVSFMHLRGNSENST